MSNLPRRCKRYLQESGYAFSERMENGVAAVIIDRYSLPPDKFDHDEVSLLLLLPDGYPDAAPDMFYVYPWLKLQSSRNWPTAASAEHSFADKKWQRWSRHWQDWRPGIDGMWTWLIKVQHALDNAK